MKRMIVSETKPFSDGWYFGIDEFEQYGDMVSERCSGMVISKSSLDDDKPWGLRRVSEELGMEDLYVLLRTLEGMCYNGTAREISDYQYKVL